MRVWRSEVEALSASLRHLDADEPGISLACRWYRLAHNRSTAQSDWRLRHGCTGAFARWAGELG
jgi:hypothetical protein